MVIWFAEEGRVRWEEKGEKNNEVWFDKHVWLARCRTFNEE